MQTFVSNTKPFGCSSEQEELNNTTSHSYLQSTDYSKNPINYSDSESIKDAAQLMTDKHLNTNVVVNKHKPIGIIRDKDLRTELATGKTGISESLTAAIYDSIISKNETR